MDTKSKKINLNIVVKAICVFLSIVCVMGSAAIGIKWIQKIVGTNYEESDAVYVENILKQGKKFNLETSEMFKDQFDNFSFLAYRQALIFKDASQNAYKQHKKIITERCDDYVEEEVKDIISTINNESNRNNFYYTFFYYEKDYISLEKIANSEDKNSNDILYYYQDEDNYGVYNGSEYDDYEDYEEYEEYEEECTEYVPTAANGSQNDQGESTVPEPTAAHNSQYKTDDAKQQTEYFEVQTKSAVDIPQSVKDKAGKCDTIVKINNSFYGASEIGFDGYYKVTVKKDKIRSDYQKNIILDEDSEEINYNNAFFSGNRVVFNNYDSFASCAAENKKNLKEYKSFYYAAYFKESGEVVSNHPSVKSNSSQENIKKVFSRYDWNWSHDSQNESAVFSENIQDYISADYNYYNWIGTDQFERKTNLPADAFTKYDPVIFFMAFDDSGNHEDPILLISGKYKQIYEDFVLDCIFVAIFVVLFLICILILILKSGRRSGDSEIYMLKTDNIYTSLKILLNGTVIAFGIYMVWLSVADCLSDLSGGAYEILMALTILGCGAIAAVAIDLLLYITRHIKNHSLFKNLIIGRVVCFISRKINAKRDNLKNKPAVYKDIFNDVLKKIVFGLILPNTLLFSLVAVFLLADELLISFLLACCLIAYDIFALGYVMRYFYYLRIIFYDLNQLRNGNNNVHVETEKMPNNVRAYAEDLNAIGDGLKIAVENAVREEKTKTELITNVSHDLKTPLTSIINYVDLLSRCDIASEEAQGYIEVLLEKSAKLKRLIEDLVEASKASTGNISVDLIEVSINELIMQIVGEYEDEFSEKDLQIVLENSEHDITVYADSKLSYRVLDNLMNNIKKYALASTRVYISVFTDESNAKICFKNISEKPLNVAPSELMQRFVRGDSSRSTDGNGLGLSIAENLCSLQGGKLTIEINGDLFIATAEFKIKQ